MAEEDDANEDYTVFGEYLAGVAIWKILPPLLVFIGTFGNIINVYILMRQRMNQSASTVYLVVLACADLCVLYTGLLRHWLLMTFQIDIRHFNSTMCKLHTWLVYTSLDFSAWIMVAVTIERVILVWLPLKARQMCTKGSAIKAILLILFILVLVNGHILFGMGDIECEVGYERNIDGCSADNTTAVNFNCSGTNYSNSTCKPIEGAATVVKKCTFLTPEYGVFFDQVWPWVDLLIFCFLPFCCLLLGNIMISFKIMSITRSNRRIVATATEVENSANPSNPSRQSTMLRISQADRARFSVTSVAAVTGNTKLNTKSSSMSIMLLVVNTVFLVCSTPISVYLISHGDLYRGASAKSQAVLSLTWAVVNILMYSNNTFNFLLYCISGNRYRKEVKAQFWRIVNGTIPATAQEQRLQRQMAMATVIQPEQDESDNDDVSRTHVYLRPSDRLDHQ